jgi:DNA repair ATPase RecN
MNMRNLMTIAEAVQPDRELRKLLRQRREINKQIDHESSWLESYTDSDPRLQEVYDSIDELKSQLGSVEAKIKELRG